MRLASLGEHVLLVMWVQLAVILLAARLVGWGMRRIGQPPVVGELLAGVLLGPSVLGKAWAGAEHFLVPSAGPSAAPLNAIGWLGVALLLLLTGFETDIPLIRRLGRSTAAVSAGGLAVPFLAGLGVGYALPAAFRGSRASSVAFVLFIAVSLSISSLPVIAKILDELGFMRRNFGQVTVAVGMVNDLVGWLALGIIAALGRSRHLSLSGVAIPVVAIAVILLFAFTAGRRLIDLGLREIRRREANNVDAMGLVLVATFGLAALTQVARSDAVLGAYIAGIVIGRSPYFPRRVRTQLEAVTNGALAPIFFATAGLRIDLGELGTARGLTWAAVILLAAVATKVVGALAGAGVAGLPKREGLALAIALNARGAVEVVIATVGLSIGVLSATAYTAIVLMAIVTSVIAPPLLRLVAHGWAGTEEEQERLEREEALERNLLIRAGRLMIPSRGGRNSVAVAQILHAAWPLDTPVTLVSVGREHDLSPVLAALKDRAVTVEQVEEGGTREAIVTEAKLGYSAVGLGARDDPSAAALLSPVVDDVLAECPVPMVIARLGREDERRLAQRAAGARILVPVAGTLASRTAQELAYAVARSTDAEVVLTHVVTRPEEPYSADGAEGTGGQARNLEVVTAAGGILEQAVRHAAEHDVAARSTVRSGQSAAEEIMEAAESSRCDMIVLGTTVRRLEDRPFLGHTVEHILRQARAEVVVVATPDTLAAGGVADRE